MVYLCSWTKQEGFVAEDDISASEHYEREVDEEAEFKRSQEAALAENAKRAAENGATGSAPPTEAAGPSVNGHGEAGMHISSTLLSGV